jgi:hypothetical protein
VIISLFPIKPNMTHMRRAGETYSSGRLLDDSPNGPKTTSDLSRRRRNGTPDQSKDSMGDLKNGERLDDRDERTDGDVSSAQPVSGLSNESRRKSIVLGRGRRGRGLEGVEV